MKFFIETSKTLLDNKKIELSVTGLHLISLLSEEMWEFPFIQQQNLVKVICETSEKHKKKTSFIKCLLQLIEISYINTNANLGKILIDFCSSNADLKGQKL